MTETIDERLALAGDALHRAWQRDLGTTALHSRRRRALVVMVVIALVIGSGAAIASSLLKSPSAEQTGMREASTLFAGSSPTCVARSAAAFHCTLDRPPTGETFYGSNGVQLLDVFEGIKLPTTDEAHRIDGGCIADRADGLSWDCYLGDAAVARGVVSRELLGQPWPGPSAG